MLFGRDAQSTIPEPAGLRPSAVMSVCVFLGSPDSPWKVAALAQLTLRRLPAFDNLRLRRTQRFQFSEKDGNLFVSLNPAELFFGYQQAKPHQRSRWSPACHRFTLAQTRSTMEKADSMTLVLANVFRSGACRWLRSLRWGHRAKTMMSFEIDSSGTSV